MSTLFNNPTFVLALGIIVKASLLLAVAGALQMALGRRVSAAARHLVWSAAIAGLVLLPAVSIAVPGWDAVRLPAPAAPAVSVARGAVERTEDSISGRSGRLDVDVDRRDATPSPVSAPRRSIPWTMIAVVLYGIGVATMIGRLAADREALRRLRRAATTVRDPEWLALIDEGAGVMGIRYPVEVLRSRERTMPMAFGIRRPAILIPVIADTWDDDRRRAVVLHELAHVARRDCLTELLAGVARAMYWFHPGVWLAAYHLQIERERACDDRVLSAGAQARDYAGHLLELAYALGSERAHTLAVAMARPRQLEGRMLALLDAARLRGTPGVRARVAGLVIAVAVLLTIAGARAVRVSAGDEVGQTQPGAAPPVARGSSTDTPVGRVPGQDGPPGTWEVHPSQRSGFVQVRASEGRSSWGTTVAIDQLERLTGARLVDGPVHFTVKRDAGTFTIEGVIRTGVGAGFYTFAPDAAFTDALAKRGLGRPTAGEQYILARSDIGFAFLDELAAQRYTRPVLAQLLNAARNGVGLAFLREMGALGYRLGLVDALVYQRQNGVSPEYIRGMAEQGLKDLSADDLVRARQHGVDPDYVKGLVDLGYKKLSLDEWIGLRNHGIDPDYVRGLAAVGYTNQPIDTLLQLRNHGVDPDYVKGLAALGYAKLPLDTLIELRNHGVDPEYVKGLAALGYRGLSREQLIELRNHGVDPDYIDAFKDLGYANLSLDELVDLRNIGVSPERVSLANRRAGVKLSVDRLKALASSGWR